MRYCLNFGGINLEDISAPRCFEIEKGLRKCLPIPVFHDDQHGTAIVVLAGIINALKIVKKDPSDMKVVINGAGSAGIAICKLLMNYGFKNVVLCGRRGIFNRDTEKMNWMQAEMVKVTNLENAHGNTCRCACWCRCIYQGFCERCRYFEMVKKMNRDAIIFAMANPDPEILPDEAKAAGARIIGTGRSDFPNQVNNVVAFPGIFKEHLRAGQNQ